MSIFQSETETLIQKSSLLPTKAEKERWIKEILPKLSPIKLMRVRDILLNHKKYNQAKLDYYQYFYDKIEEANRMANRFIIANKEKAERKKYKS